MEEESENIIGPLYCTSKSMGGCWDEEEKPKEKQKIIFFDIMSKKIDICEV